MTEKEFEQLFEREPIEWLDSLPKYQRESFDTLLTSGSPEEVAKKWLSSNFSNTAAFGAPQQSDSSLFLDRIKVELKAFLCGDPKYNSERKEFLKYRNQSKTVLASAISVALAPHVGAAAAFIGPVIVLLLYSFGKMSLRAYCGEYNEGKSDPLVGEHKEGESKLDIEAAPPQRQGA